VLKVAEYRTAAAKLTGEPSLALLFRRLSETKAITIAQIAGRVRGGGSEFVLACDMRFASLERAIFGQLKVATGVIPGGGAVQHLSRLMGRARALEVIASADEERVHAITLAPEADFRRDSELFGEGFRDGEAKRRTGLLLNRGLQTRSETELNLGRVLGEFDS